MKFDPKYWWDKYTKLKWERQTLILVVFLSIIPIAGSLLLRPPRAKARGSVAQRDIDTYIPRGFVLVPIEVQNYEALDSILGRYGIVDLFQSASADGSPEQVVARNIRILRAPQNPSHFAVLVPETEAPRLLKFGASFTVTVKGRAASGTKFVESIHKAKRRIVYEGN